MLRTLGSLFDTLKAPAEATGGADHQHTLQLATAVLLVEVVRADGKVDEAEREGVLHALRSRFALTPEELDDLYELAHEKSEHSHDLYGFTARLNESLGEVDRIQVFELLWSVAWSNGRADDHEAHLLRRLADLLHLRHGDAIGAKLRAEAAQKASRPG